MKKLLLIVMITILSLGSRAYSNNNITTVKTTMPVKLIIEKDSIFNVKTNYSFINWEIVNDTVLKISSNRIEDNDTPIVKIKTPNKLNIELARYLTIIK